MGHKKSRTSKKRKSVAKMISCARRIKKEKLTANTAEVIEEMTSEEYAELMSVEIDAVIEQEEVEDDGDENEVQYLDPVDVSLDTVNDMRWSKGAGNQFRKQYTGTSKASRKRKRREEAARREIAKGQAFSFKAWQKPISAVEETNSDSDVEVIGESDGDILAGRMSEL